MILIERIHLMRNKLLVFWMKCILIDMRKVKVLEIKTSLKTIIIKELH